MSSLTLVQPTKTVVGTDDQPPRPRSWRRDDAWHECDVAPCGESGQLRWHYCSGHGIYPERTPSVPDLSDCLAVMPKPWLLTVWEPLHTKAPGPHLASAYCCYINTVIFYGSPYVVWPYPKVWNCNGSLKLNSGPTFLEWDSIETRLTWNDQIIYRGLIFEKGGGRVLWTHAPGDRRRWWMRHGLRRKREGDR